MKATKKPTRSDVAAAIKVLQAAISGLPNAEIVIGDGLLRVLPEVDEYDCASAADVFACIGALKTLRRIAVGHEISECEAEEQPAVRVMYATTCV